jgi:DNA-binding CsgD family transcriptional regulator
MTTHNPGLTPRERAVVNLLCEGVTIEEIVITSGVTRKSVLRTLRNIRIKLGVRSEVSLWDYFGDGCSEREALMK